MKIKPTHLFYILSLLSALTCVLLWTTTKDKVMLGSFFIIGIITYLFIISLFSLFTAAIYSVMTKINRPISRRLGFFHFFIFIVGLLFSINGYNLYITATMLGAPIDIGAFAFDEQAIVTNLLGLVFLLTGLFIFFVGLIKAKKHIPTTDTLA